METVETAPKKKGLSRWLPLLGLGGVMALVFATGTHRYLSPVALVENYASLKAFTESNLIVALGIYIAVYALATAASLPGALILTIAGGLFFGGLVGGLATVLGATIGATLIFLIARTSLGASLREKAGPFIAKMQQGFQDDAVSYLLFLRLVPVFPFWLVNLAPALLGVALVPYVLTTFFGIIPGTFAYSFAGAGIDGIVAAQAEALSACQAAGGADCSVSLGLADLVNRDILIAMVALGVVSLIPVVAKKVLRKKKASSSSSQSSE